MSTLNCCDKPTSSLGLNLKPINGGCTPTRANLNLGLKPIESCAGPAGKDGAAGADGTPGNNGVDGTKLVVTIPVPSGTIAVITVNWQTDIPTGQTKTYAALFGNRRMVVTDWYESVTGTWNLAGNALQPVITVVAGLITTFVIPYTYDNSVNRELIIC